MRITICGSVDFSPAILDVVDQLEARGDHVNLPYFTGKMRDGSLSFADWMAMRDTHHGMDTPMRESAQIDFLKRYWDFIIQSDAILVMNMSKKGIPHYIGGNTLMEMGFAYGHRKKIYLYHPVPEPSERMHYVDELISLKPIVINGDLSQIKP